MSVRRDTDNRRTLFRECGTCGRTFVTSAGSPWMRQVPKDGKRQCTTYYCSSKCLKASYKHIGWYDGKAEERRKAKEARRDRSESNRLYYAANAERERERARLYFAENREACLAAMRYSRMKRKLIQMEVDGSANISGISCNEDRGRADKRL